MLNEPGSQPEEKKPKKEMLTLSQSGSQTVVRINSSSLDLLQTCLRKAHYRLNRNLEPLEGSAALDFGTAIHAALEYWYQLPNEERELPKALHEDADLMATCAPQTVPAQHGALEAIRLFIASRHATLSQLPPEDKRSMESGIRILKAYFKHYANDGFVVARDAAGLPLVEKAASAVLAETPELKIEYFGTIDTILQNTQTGIIMVADHKTTHALGKEFYDRCKPNPQYTGYVWLAREALGINTNLFMINGIQVAKTKIEFARQITDRTEEDFDELKQSVGHRVNEWLHSQRLEYWPMTSPNPCSMYSGCTYRRVCEVPGKLRENVIEALFRAK